MSKTLLLRTAFVDVMLLIVKIYTLIQRIPVSLVTVQKDIQFAHSLYYRRMVSGDSIQDVQRLSDSLFTVRYPQYPFILGLGQSEGSRYGT